MYSHEYPVIGCWCCKEAHEQITFEDYDIYQTCKADPKLKYDNCYNERALHAHNEYRRMHGAHNLIFDAPIAEKAQDVADYFNRYGRQSQSISLPVNCG